MKKIFVLVSIIILGAIVTGCSFFPFTTASTTTVETTTAAPATTASTEIDLDMILSEVYNRIYAEMYDQIRAEVAASLTQEQFDAIYAQVVADVLAGVEDGSITVDPQTAIEEIASVAMNEANAVIAVTTSDSDGTPIALGSGIIYKHVGDLYFVVTNNHVVEDGSSFEIQTPDEETYVGLLRGVDATVDVAVLTFSAADTDYQTASFGDSDAVTKGTIVLAVGNPSSIDYYGSMTMGIVSGVDRYFDIDGDNVRDMFVNYIQHDASINAGNSGGALFNLAGEVIGINVIKIAATEIEGMGFAIPSNLVSAICADIELYGVSKVKPVLGITFVDIYDNPEYFTYYGIELPEGIDHGFYVLDVGTGSTLDGIVEAGDIVTRIGEIDIVDTDGFVDQFTQYHVGDIISVTVYRNGQYVTFDNVELLPKA
jgi:serine protease Do